MNRRIVFGVCCFLSLLQTGRCTSPREQEKKILDEILSPERYDRRIRAFGNESSLDPTVCSVNFFVRSIQVIDDLRMEYKVQLTFRMQWIDTRLTYSEIRTDCVQNNRQCPLPRYLTLDSTPDELWIPDLFFANEVDSHAHNLLKPNTYIRIFPNGDVLYSSRVTLTLSCPMILKLYPLDKQTCSLRMASYAFTTDDLIFKWKEFDPVQVTKEIYLPQFSLEQFTTDNCDSQTNTGIYSCLRVDFLFRREFSQFLLQVFIPSIMCVIVAYLVFWIDRKETITRVMVAMVTLFVMAAGTLAMNRTVPQVSYTKAIDVWTGVCLTFIFGALVTCIIVNFLGSDKDKGENAVTELHKTEGTPLRAKGQKSKVIAQKYSEMPLPQKMDVLARIVYPTLFVLFVIFYAGSYALKKD